MKFNYIAMREMNNSGDLDMLETNNLEEAKAWCNNIWNHLTDREKLTTTTLGVLESVNPDEQAYDHLDGDFVYIIKAEGNSY